MNNRKYPTSLFVIGFITNMLFYYSWLFIPSVILSTIGIFVQPCLYIGMSLLLIDVVLSLTEQIKIRQTFLEESHNPEFREFQDALSKDGNWRDNIGELLNRKVNGLENEDKSDDESEDE